MRDEKSSTFGWFVCGPLLNLGWNDPFVMSQGWPTSDWELPLVGTVLQEAVNRFSAHMFLIIINFSSMIIIVGKISVWGLK